LSLVIRADDKDGKKYAETGKVWCMACNGYKNLKDATNWAKHEKTEK